MRLAAASCPGLDPCQPVPACSPSRGGSGRGAGEGRAWDGATCRWLGPSKRGEHLSKASGARRVLRSGDYRSELQKHVTNLAQRWRGELDEPAQRGRVGSPGAVPEPGALAWPPVLRASGRTAVQAALAALAVGAPAPRSLRPGPRLLGQVETSPFKPARANQGLARPPVQTRLGPAPAGPPAPASETPAARGGRVNLLPRLRRSNTDASGYRLSRRAWGRGHGALPAPRLPGEPARAARLVFLPLHLW